MKTLVYILGGIGLGVFGVHVYNDAGKIPMAPTPMVAESRVVVSPQGWSVEPVAPSSLSESANRPVVKPPEPASYSNANRNQPVITPPVSASRVAEVVGPIVAPPRGKDYASEPWAQPARVQVDYAPKLSSIKVIAGLAVAVLAAVALLLLVDRSKRPRRSSPPDTSALVHELARRAQDLSQRMEALETILLDRTRTAR